jgi:hypothetical protein
MTVKRAKMRESRKMFECMQWGVEVRTCKVVEAAAVVAAPFVPEGDNLNCM